MEFRFNVNEVFKQPIVEINASLIPPGLSLADKRALWDAVAKVSDVVNTMGEASATAQGLTKPITTSERLRNSEHKLYLLIDQNANNGKGVVTGMLKTGKKGLYVFDRDGHHYQVQPACVLDFYIHETKQRMGLGKKLFEHMLEREEVEPVKMAIDRPSDKFLGFLNKHYSLDNPVKQMNNFVVYDGFFPESCQKGDSTENNNTPLGKSNQSANGLQTSYASPYGRYGAPRPPCSMGQIIHNQSPLAQQTQEPAGDKEQAKSPTEEVSPVATAPPPKLERPQSLSLQPSEDIEGDEEIKVEILPQTNTKSNVDIVEDIKKLSMQPDEAVPPSKTPDKGEGDGTRKTPSHLTEQGFFDLKFYHNKLW